MAHTLRTDVYNFFSAVTLLSMISSHLWLETTKWLKTFATWLSLTLKMLWIITLHQRLCLDWTTFQLKCQENMQCIFRPKYRCFHQKFVGFSCFQRMLFKVLFDSETTLNLTLWSKYIFCIHLTTISCPIFKIDFYRCKCSKDFIWPQEWRSVYD